MADADATALPLSEAIINDIPTAAVYICSGSDFMDASEVVVSEVVVPSVLVYCRAYYGNPYVCRVVQRSNYFYFTF